MDRLRAGRRRAGWRRAGGRAAGSLTVELAVLAPALVLLLLLLAAGGRVVEAQARIDGAARDAARAASLGRSASQAPLLAQQAAAADLGAASWCAPNSVRALVAGFPSSASPPAAGADVAVTVSCEVDMSPFAALGFAARTSLSANAVAPLDPYMCRDGAC